MKVDQRTRVKVNAILAHLTYNGHDVAPIEAQVRQMVQMGHDPKAACQMAINAWIGANPGEEGQLQRLVAQVTESDHATVAAYDTALQSYLDTGDAAALAPIERMAVVDAMEMAHAAGEISREDAMAGRVDWEALGLDAATAPSIVATAFREGVAPAASPAPPPGIGGPYEGMTKEQMRAAMRGEPIPAAPQAAPASSAPQTFAFKFPGAGQAAAPGRPPRATELSSRYRDTPRGVGWTEAGYSSARALEQTRGPGIGGPYQGMSATQMRAAMRGEAVPEE